MKKLFFILSLTLTFSLNAQTVGFNYGQLYSFVANLYGAQKELPKELVKLINDKVPSSYLENARFSGTMSNYMNLHERGYGEHIEVFGQWQILTDRLPKKDRDQIAEAVAKTALKNTPLIGLFIKGANTPEQNMELLLSKTKQFVPQSYIYNFVNSVKQLGVKNVEFTFNSHMPYRGVHTLEQSLASLKYVYQNTNLTHIELENETFLADYICGTINNNESKASQSIQPFYDYLVNKVIPAIYTVVPKSIPIGLSITDHSNTKRKAYNKIVLATAEKLTKQGYKVYLTPHFYFKDSKDKTIKADIDEIIKITGGKYELRITEFNVDSKAGNMTQAQTIDFIERVRKIAGSRGIRAIYYHTILTKQGAHFSFIK